MNLRVEPRARNPPVVLASRPKSFKLELSLNSAGVAPMPDKHFRWIPVLLAGSLALSVSNAWAQGATLKGRVLDSELGEPIPGASVRVRPGGAPLTVDSTGRFEVAGVRAGEIEVAVQAIGFQSRSWKLTVQDGQTLTRDFSLDFTGEKLPDLVVTARAVKLAPRYADFERRRERGIGAYMRWDEIKKKNFNTVGQAMRSIRGVRLECDQQEFECFVKMARTPNCMPQWYVDGVQVSMFHENTPIRDVYGLEIYRGPGEVPGEFSGSQAGCGVLVVWTKSKPYQ
jgi:Carboxypeptidase regulatory-like domain